MSKRIVIVAATENEIAPLKKALPGYEYVVTGIGATNTAVNVTAAAVRLRPDMMISVGIAGAVDKSLNIGEVVFVTEDRQADLGAWRAEQNIFIGFETPIFKIINHSTLQGVKSRSVNTACSPLFDNGISTADQIETMEGAAFFQATSLFPMMQAIQIRAISNYTDSPRHDWEVEKAIEALAESFQRSLEYYL